MQSFGGSIIAKGALGFTLKILRVNEGTQYKQDLQN